MASTTVSGKLFPFSKGDSPSMASKVNCSFRQSSVCKERKHNNYVTIACCQKLPSCCLWFAIIMHKAQKKTVHESMQRRYNTVMLQQVLCTKDWPIIADKIDLTNRDAHRFQRKSIGCIRDDCTCAMRPICTIIAMLRLTSLTMLLGHREMGTSTQHMPSLSFVEV